jgi:hypothetical protein
MSLERRMGIADMGIAASNCRLELMVLPTSGVDQPFQQERKWASENIDRRRFWYG